MFNTILKRAPFSDIAAQVMLFRGMVLERQGKTDEAITIYQQIIERFPGEKAAEEAQYQIGYVRMNNLRTGSNNPVDRLRAQESFEDYMSRASTSEKAAQARENLQVIETKNLQSTLDIAKFYDKDGKIKAAAIYYRDLIDIAPNSPQGQFAKKRIDELKSIHGVDAVRSSNSVAENADTAASRKRMQAAINTSSRADYVGPQIKKPLPATPKGPALRISPSDLGPLPEPALPLTDPILNPDASLIPKKAQ